MSVADVVNTWAAAAAGLGSAAIAMRARMLRPESRTWTRAPRVVWVALWVLALGLACAAMNIWFGQARANAREAAVYSFLAVAGVVMLWNLNRNGREVEVRRKRIEDDVRTALNASGPAARYPWERFRG